MRFKSEFRRRLIHLRHNIDIALVNDLADKAENTANLFPSMHSAFSYIWCFKTKELFKK